MEPIVCSETSASNYHYTLRNNHAEYYSGDKISKASCAKICHFWEGEKCTQMSDLESRKIERKKRRLENNTKRDCVI